VYDIEDDRVRLRVAGICKDFGLSHIQYSAFCGPLDATRRSELFARLADTLGTQRGRIVVIPVCERDVRAQRMVINER
jgi:CRISPR-associated protein Cas2